ncbi:hypothetical protein DID96_27595 [Burkholderia sp. Bp8963]|nr:hypothetical protein DID96_27595 [Burkholderia sp. Bp8963]
MRSSVRRIGRRLLLARGGGASLYDNSASDRTTPYVVARRAPAAGGTAYRNRTTGDAHPDKNA